MWQASERFKESIRGYHAPYVRVRAMSTVQFGYPLETDGEVLDVISGDVNFSSTAEIKSSLNITIAGRHWNTVQPYGVELFAERGIDYNDGTYEMAPLGYFRVQKPKQDDAPNGPIVITASDRGIRLKEHRVVSPYNYPTGTTHRQIFDQLINGLSLSPSPFDVITYPMYRGKIVPITFFGYDPDKAKLPAGVVDDFVGDFLAKIADARGCVIYFDRLGGLVVDQRDKAPGTDPVYTIEPGSNGNMIKYSREVDRASVYNVVAARGSDPAYPTGLGLTYNDDATSPLRYDGPFEAVVRKYASPLLHTTDQAGSASRKLVLRYQGLPSGTSAVTLPDPTIDPLDVLLLRPVGLPEELAVADTVKVPLDLKTPVTVGVRAQNEVSDEPDTTGTDDGDGGGGPVFPAAFRDARAYPAVVGTGSTNVVNVSTSAQLTSALAAAVAGQVITLADGTYSGAFTINKKGTQAQPIVVKAANVGKAVLASGSSFTADGAEWLLVTGLAAPYDTAGDIFLMKGACKFVRFTRNLVGPAVGPVTPDSWKLGFSSCINAATSQALARAASMGLDGWYNSGDTWYKDGNTPAFEADWQEKFDTSEYSSLLASLKRKWHWVNVSDHEGYANNAPATAFGSAFQAAYRNKFAGKTLGPLPDVGIYCSGNVGRVGIILLDQRSFRSLDSATDNSSKTMLGATQKAWFKNLIASNAYPVWIVLGDVPIHTPTQAGDDSWAGFNTERVELQSALDASTSKFIYLHGNMHALMRKANTFGYDLALGAAPLNNLTKVSAGGDNIDASYPTNANEGTVAQQFGVLSVTDTGTAINFSFKGYDADGTERTTVAATLSVSAPGPAQTSASTPAGNYFRITDQAQDCVVDYNELRNKVRPGNGIAVDGDTTVSGNAGGCQHILVAHNDFHDFGTEIDNGFEAIRFGTSDLSRTPSNSAVIRNVFTNILTEPEVISIKMAKVDVWGNSLNRCIGGIVYRHGTDGYVGHNYMLGPATGVAGTKSGGVRGYDANHEFSENYMYGTNGDGFTGALVIDGGDSGTPALNGHWPLRNTKARKNLIVGCQTGILIGPNYTVAPDSIQVTDNLVVAPVGQTTALKTTKAPTGTNVLDPNLYAASTTAAGVVADADGIYRKSGVGPRLTYLRRGDVGVAGDLNETDGSGKSVTGVPGGTPGGGGDTPGDPGPGTGGTATSVANLLKIGAGPGLTKCNIGIGFGPEQNGGAHKDYDLAAIEQGLSVPGYFELTPDKLRARLSAHLDGGRTSTKTKYPRTEFRQLKSDGTTKMSFNPNEAKTRRVGCCGRVTKMPPNKPQLVLAQSHDADDDTSMIYMNDKKTVQAKLGDTVVGTLESNFVFGTDYYYMIEIIGDGSKCKLNYYWATSPSGLATPKFTTANATRSTTWYLKAGDYAQSNKDTDSVSDGPFIVELSKFFMWETGMPAPLGWV